MYSHADIHSLSGPKKASSSTVSNLSKRGERGDLQDVRGSFIPIYSTSSTDHFPWLCWEIVNIDSHVWVRLVKKPAVLFNFCYLRVRLGRVWLANVQKNKGDSCLKWYFQKVLLMPRTPFLLWKAALFYLLWLFWCWWQVRSSKWPWMVFHKCAGWGTMAVMKFLSSRTKPWIPLGGNWVCLTSCT